MSWLTSKQIVRMINRQPDADEKWQHPIDWKVKSAFPFMRRGTAKQGAKAVGALQISEADATAEEQKAVSNRDKTKDQWREEFRELRDKHACFTPIKRMTLEGNKLELIRKVAAIKEFLSAHG